MFVKSIQNIGKNKINCMPVFAMGRVSPWAGPAHGPRAGPGLNFGVTTGFGRAWARQAKNNLEYILAASIYLLPVITRRVII